MECIVLAGGTPATDHELYRWTRGAPKAMLPIAGRPMIAWVIDALRSAACIDRIVVVGLSAPAAAAVPQLGDTCDLEGVEFIAGAGSLVDNLYTGIAAAQGSPLLYCGSDIPLVRGAMVDRFVERGWRSGLDIAAGLVSRRSIQHRYPGAEDLWLRLREGEFIAADLAVFDPAAAPAARRHLQALAPRRKSAMAQAWYVGVPLLLRYASGRLRTSQLEVHLRRRFGLTCHVQQATDPELGLDVDGEASLSLCRRALQAVDGTR